MKRKIMTRISKIIWKIIRKYVPWQKISFMNYLEQKIQSDLIALYGAYKAEEKNTWQRKNYY